MQKPLTRLYNSLVRVNAPTRIDLALANATIAATNAFNKLLYPGDVPFMYSFGELGLNRATMKLLDAIKPLVTASCQPRTIVARNFLTSLASLLFILLFCGQPADAQTSVLTQHYDNLRSGANTNETILNPSNVNTSSFGKLFSQLVDGYVFAQPLYLPAVTMGAGTAQPATTHNVVFIATENDSVYAFDADTSAGANASPLWHITLLDAAHGAATGATTVPPSDVSNPVLGPAIGITGTPVIDPLSGTLYVVGVTKENGTYVHRLHALDITTGAEKASFNSPVTLAASVPGNGSGSVSGTMTFDDKWELQRAGLLLLNGIVYSAYGSQNDNGPWHGWILAYNAATLHQTGVYCATPNSAGSGIWMAGSGLAADVVDPVNHPYGRMFIATGNGTYDATIPYTNSMDYGDDHLRLDLTNGVLTVQDAFTPFNQANLDLNDTDTGSGGILLLPNQTVGGHTHLLVQVGKDGRIFLVDRDTMGGYCSTCSTLDTNIVQELPGAIPNGLWGMPAYWNGNLYFWGDEDFLRAFSFTNGLLSSSPTSTSSEQVNYEGSTPTVSAQGATNGIVWNIDSATAHFVLMAHNALNVADTLYSTTQNSSRDAGSNGVRFTVPTVINGKVYAGDQNQINVYGLLNGVQQASAPIISPSSETFNSSVQVSITDSTPGAVIYYTTNGSVPTPTSTKYTSAFAVSSTTTVNAIAVATGYLQSPRASQIYTLLTQAAVPTFNPPPGIYTTPQSISMATTTPSALIYFTTDGSTPSPGVGTTKQYTGPILLSATTVLNAIATATGLTNSPIANGTYTISLGGVTSINFSTGFTAGGMVLEGSAALTGSSLRLTDGGANEAAAAWYNVNAVIQTFTTSFSFQLSPGTSTIGNGFTFTIQENSTSVIGGPGNSLGYGPNPQTGGSGIGNSVAVKFDLSTGAGNSTGIYVNGAAPTTPLVDLTGTGINLHSGDQFNVSMSYNSAVLSLTITDATTNAKYSTSFPIDIPGTIGNTAGFVGFTAGTGTNTAIQKILNWSFSYTGIPTATPTFSPASGTYSGAQTVTINDTTPGSTIYYTTNGTLPTTASTLYGGPISVATSETVNAIAAASGYAIGGAGTAAYSIQSGSPAINFGDGFASTTGLQLNGSAVWNQTASRVRLTDSNATGYESGSTFFTTPVNVQSFTNSFSFQLTAANADGFTFTIQSAGDTALGPYGGGLGYAWAGSTPFPQSVAVKFDLYNNAGEGNDSTGMYTDGATPALPSVDMTSSGVNLHSGDIMNVLMTYDGTTLSWTITDAATGKTFSTSAAVNIPALVGGSTTFVGFTGGTGGETAIQEILSWVYTPGSGTTQSPAATPTFSPAAGTYTSAQSVVLSDTTSGAAIYYTTNGTAPTTSSTKYSTAIAVGSTQTIQAIAVAPGFTNSSVSSAAYTINLPTPAAPTFSPAAGTYTSAQSVVLSDTTTGAAIYYTTNGTTPTTSSTKYGSAIAVGSTQTIQAIAVAAGFTNSAVASAAYTINLPTAATPVFSPAAGTYTSVQSITISDTTSGAAIYYTTNGTTPTTSSTKYSVAIAVGSTQTIQAIAVAAGFNNSAVASAAYTINLPTAATPTFSPAAGTYTSAQSVVLSDTTTGAAIYYTTDGTTPTTSSTKYGTAIAVSSTQTIQAIAVAAGFNNSAVASAAYTIQSGALSINFGGGFPSSTGLTLNGGASIVSNRLRLTDGGVTEARSAFFTTPVNIQSFTNNFSFQLSNATGDGFTFVIQGDSSPTWLGPTGAGLGYGAGAPGAITGIPLSIAVKFDIYNNNGEGSDSTGLYINGASPTIPAMDMTSSGVLLSSGDVFNVAMTYDGSTLSWTTTDATTGKSFSTSATLNLLNIIESPTAYVGFAGSTGGSVATQDILSWTFTGTPISGAKLPIRYETESLSGVSSGPSYGVTNWAGFTDGAGTILQSTAVGDSVTIPINVPAAATYNVRVGAKATNARAIMQLSVNGANVGSPTDEYFSAGYTWSEFNLGNVTLPAGSQPFKFTVTGKNPASSAYQLTFDYITLIPQ